MIINHNLPAMNTYRQMSTNASITAKSLQKLSSGMRINSAADDAAGLAISEKMRGQIRGLDQASRNAQDGISLIQTAEGALNEIHAIIQRMSELATQAANETATNDDRQYIQEEINQLSSEINRIGNTTEFNTMKLLKGGGVESKIAAKVVESFGVKLDGAAAGNMAGAKIDTTTAIAGHQATYLTGDFTTVLSDGGYATLQFNGVTLNIRGTNDPAKAGAQNIDYAKSSLDLVIDTAAHTAAADQAADIVAALNAYKATATGPVNELTGWGITVAGNGLQFQAAASTAAYNNLTVTTTGSLQLTNTVNGTQLTSANKGVDAIAKDNKAYDINVATMTGSVAAVGATWTSGAIDSALFLNGSTTNITFNGVSVVIKGADGKPVGAAATDKYNASVTIDTTATIDVDERRKAIAKGIVDAFNAAKAFGGEELKKFTFELAGDDTTAGDGANVHFIIRGAEADGAKNNKLYIGQSGVALLANVGSTYTAENAANVKGVDEVCGKYQMVLDKSFEKEGVQLKIGGQTFTAVKSGASAAKGEFNIGTSEKEQAISIANAINANSSLNKIYEATVVNNKITIAEKATKALGGDLIKGLVTNNDVAAGSYKLTIDELAPAGGKYTIDGVDIAVVKDATDARIATGQAVLYNAKIEDQTNALAVAIASNTVLNAKYTVANVGNTITLTQKAGNESLQGAKATSNTSVKANFEATLQIGANYNQCMTVDMADMRAKAIGVTGDGADMEKTASDGAVASFVKAANVTDGTSNTNEEFSLDVSTSRKATAAISVLHDAINVVSQQRSKLGAFQNRLDHTINNLGASSENLSAAESRIRDVDMAKEMMLYTKNSVLQQAAQAMLAQANQLPQGVLQLLR